MKTFHIMHPSEKCAIQLLTQDDVTVDDVRFDCLVLLGEEPPTSIAEGRPDNIVWP